MASAAAADQRQLSLTNLATVGSGATPAGFEPDFGRIISAISYRVCTAASYRARS